MRGLRRLRRIVLDMGTTLGVGLELLGWAGTCRQGRVGAIRTDNGSCCERHKMAFGAASSVKHRATASGLERFRQMTEQRAHVGERDQIHDGRDCQRPGQGARPVGARQRMLLQG